MAKERNHETIVALINCVVVSMGAKLRVGRVDGGVITTYVPAFYLVTNKLYTRSELVPCPKSSNQPLNPHTSLRSTPPFVSELLPAPS